VVGTDIAMHNNGLLGDGEIESFCLDVGSIAGNVHFSIFSMRTLGVYIFS